MFRKNIVLQNMGGLLMRCDNAPERCPFIRTSVRSAAQTLASFKTQPGFDPSGLVAPPPGCVMY
jgi:hypothetical protein